jgi:hypothetical protein
MRRRKNEENDKTDECATQKGTPTQQWVNDENSNTKTDRQ